MIIRKTFSLLFVATCVSGRAEFPSYQPTLPPGALNFTCLPGFFIDSKKCIPCSADTYTDSSNEYGCSPCPVFFREPKIGSSSCSAAQLRLPWFGSLIILLAINLICWTTFFINEKHFRLIKLTLILPRVIQLTSMITYFLTQYFYDKGVFISMMAAFGFFIFTYFMVLLDRWRFNSVWYNLICGPMRIGEGWLSYLLYWKEVFKRSILCVGWCAVNMYGIILFSCGLLALPNTGVPFLHAYYGEIEDIMGCKQFEFGLKVTIKQYIEFNELQTADVPVIDDIEYLTAFVECFYDTSMKLRGMPFIHVRKGSSANNNNTYEFSVSDTLWYPILSMNLVERVFHMADKCIEFSFAFGFPQHCVSAMLPPRGQRISEEYDGARRFLSLSESTLQARLQAILQEMFRSGNPHSVHYYFKRNFKLRPTAMLIPQHIRRFKLQHDSIEFIANAGRGTLFNMFLMQQGVMCDDDYFGYANLFFFFLRLPMLILQMINNCHPLNTWNAIQVLCLLANIGPLLVHFSGVAYYRLVYRYKLVDVHEATWLFYLYRYTPFYRWFTLSCLWCSDLWDVVSLRLSRACSRRRQFEVVPSGLLDDAAAENDDVDAEMQLPVLRHRSRAEEMSDLLPAGGAGRVSEEDLPMTALAIQPRDEEGADADSRQGEMNSVAAHSVISTREEWMPLQPAAPKRPSSRKSFPRPLTTNNEGTTADRSEDALIHAMASEVARNSIATNLLR